MEAFPKKLDRRRGVRKPIARCHPCERIRHRGAMAALRKKAASTYQRDVVRLGRAQADRRAWARRGRGAIAVTRASYRAARPKRRTQLTTVERREYWRRYQAWRRVNHPERASARRAVQRAVECGMLTKPGRCSDCCEPTEPAALHGHHHLGYDPTVALEVTWLCVPCHVDAEGGWGGGAPPQRYFLSYAQRVTRDPETALDVTTQNHMSGS